MPLADRIVVDSKILTGKPVVRGTRLAVELVVELLAAGWSHAQILASYPHLAEEDIRACLAYASEFLREEKVYPLDTA
ncbi:MAG TPA: DUF433 domain-containing protein [Candidatus Acidoferrales bacterium]|jgi:uncharacterized protein (DUF433 family)|nr:DUF433 domain-containing protein [Candidatus Acidoferrales bacterium]